jgi:hypothetical protein
VNTAIDGTYTILSVTAKNKFTIASAGANGSPAGGTYRVFPTSNETTCQISNVQLAGVATTGIKLIGCVAPHVSNVDTSGEILSLWFVDCRSPTWDNIREAGRSTQEVSIRVDSGCTWPVAGRASAASSNMNGTSGRGMAIGIDSSSAASDHPLLGTCGMAIPTGGKEVQLLGYGAYWVDGDIVQVFPGTGGTVSTLTYKASSPGAGQFNSVATLKTAIAALAGGTVYTAVDYGSQFANSSTINHVLVQKTAQTTSERTFYLVATTLNPTAGVLLYNDDSPNTRAYSLGAADAGPNANKTVVFSPCCDMYKPVVLTANNSDGATRLKDSYYKITTSKNSGACEELVHGSNTGGTEEFRWFIP